MWEQVTRKQLRPMSCTGEFRVEGRRHRRHPAHYEQGDERVRDQFDSVPVRLSLPSATFHRHPLAPVTLLHATFTGSSSCDPAPLTASFGTACQWERRHRATTSREP